MVIIREAVHKGVLVHSPGALLFRVFPCFAGTTFVETLEMAGTEPQQRTQEKVLIFFISDGFTREINLFFVILQINPLK